MLNKTEEEAGALAWASVPWFNRAAERILITRSGESLSTNSEKSSLLYSPRIRSLLLLNMISYSRNSGAKYYIYRI